MNKYENYLQPGSGIACGIFHERCSRTALQTIECRMDTMWIAGVEPLEGDNSGNKLVWQFIVVVNVIVLIVGYLCF